MPKSVDFTLSSETTFVSAVNLNFNNYIFYVILRFNVNGEFTIYRSMLLYLDIFYLQ